MHANKKMLFLLKEDLLLGHCKNNYLLATAKYQKDRPVLAPVAVQCEQLISREVTVAVMAHHTWKESHCHSSSKIQSHKSLWVQIPKLS